MVRVDGHGRSDLDNVLDFDAGGRPSSSVEANRQLPQGHFWIPAASQRVASKNVEKGWLEKLCSS